METRVSQPIQVSLHDVVEMFERWRQNRLHREIIPEELWNAALSLIPSYPATKVAQLLHLNYTKLKERMTGESRSSSSNRIPQSWSFVDLGYPAGSGCTSLPCNDAGVVIEIEKPSGRFRCTIRGSVPENVLLFCRTLLDSR